MAKVVVTKSKLDSLATSISTKSGISTPMTIDQMTSAVDSISGGGITPTGTIQITTNGTHNVATYASAEVNVSSSSPSLQGKTITANGTYAALDDDLDGYSSVTVNVPTPAPSLQTKTTSFTPTTSSQSRTVTADSGYDGLEQVNVTVEAIPSEYIVPNGTKSITENGTGIDVAQYASVDVAVPSSGSSKNVQVVQGTTRTTSSSMTAIGAEMTVSKTGTYDVYWTGVRTNTSGSYTFATRLYIDGTAYGSENTTWSNHIQNVHLSNVSLTANQKIRVYGRESRNSSYYMYAGTLIIVEA